jgi:hypothetical protein
MLMKSLGPLLLGMTAAGRKFCPSVVLRLRSLGCNPYQDKFARHVSSRVPEGGSLRRSAISGGIATF